MRAMFGAARRTGLIGAYMSAVDLDQVRAVRALTGHVTVTGKTGLKALRALHLVGDLHDIDLDPAGYLSPSQDDGALFPFDWEACQEELGLPVVRSVGRFVRAGDVAQLREAFDAALRPGTIRVVSLDGRWLRPDHLPQVLARVRHCSDPLAFVLANPFDPLEATGTVDGLQMLLAGAAGGGRTVELLRTDVSGIPFVAAGGAHSSIGLTSNARHHPLPLGKRAGQQHEVRQGIPKVFTPALLSWQQGTRLGALSPWGGAGICQCGCSGCAGRDLLRFDRAFLGTVPQEVRSDAQWHDLHTVHDIGRAVLEADDPLAAWRDLCRAAVHTAAQVEAFYRVPLRVPGSVAAWV
jgi:hypothetical protein